MKPLVLNIYEKHPDTDAYRVGGFYSPYCLVSRDKRFSEAELAAEFWHSKIRPACIKANPKGIGTTVRELGASDVSAIARFATLPHYDEADQ